MRNAENKIQNAAGFAFRVQCSECVGTSSACPQHAQGPVAAQTGAPRDQLVGSDAHIAPVIAAGNDAAAAGDTGECRPTAIGSPQPAEASPKAASQAFPLGGRCPSVRTGADDGAYRQGAASDEPHSAASSSSSVTASPHHFPLEWKAEANAAAEAGGGGEVTTALIARSQAGDKAALEQLLTENSGLIRAVARRYWGRGVEAEDLIQLGSLGFLKAVAGFDLGFGTRFSTYAVPKIAGEIRRFLRDDGAVKVSRTLKERAAAVRQARERLSKALGREPVLSELAEALDLTAEEIAEAETAADPVASIQQPAGEGGLPLEA
ncbi:MAG: sigma-70 family RNA polymerase sigma factor, partial [Oscillospiraceae bacterium]|nr:sigma-70 family RNA polymerase sigma factor [Oscillospiraceae bacterium]